MVLIKHINLRIFVFSFSIFVCFITQAGYDTLPIDSMQGLEISSPVGGGGGGGAPPSAAPTSPYSMDMDVGEIDAGALNFDLDAMPTPPNDNNNLAAWYDTDC